MMTSPTPTAEEPATLGTWLRDRKTAIKTVSLGAVTWPLAFGAAWMWWPARDAAVTDRIGYVLQLAGAPALVLLLMISSCMRLFDTKHAENPFAGAESPRFKTNQRVLANTVEQLAVFVLVLFALATRLPPSQLKLLPIAIAIWCTGRVMFWIGYHVAPHWRAPGFDWTFLTTWLLAGWFIYTLV